MELESYQRHLTEIVQLAPRITTVEVAEMAHGVMARGMYPVVFKALRELRNAGVLGCEIGRDANGASWWVMPDKNDPEAVLRYLDG